MKTSLKSSCSADLATDILIAYEAYCIQVGATHLPFAKALDNSAATRIIIGYVNMLKCKEIVKIDCAPDVHMRKIMNMLKYMRTGRHVAYAFIVYNACLRRFYHRECILSWYDLKSLIARSDTEKELVHVKNGVEVHYPLTDSWLYVTLTGLFEKSVYDVDDVHAWITQDSALAPIALWLTSESCCIDKDGLVSEVIEREEDCEKRRYVRDNIVFTKLLIKHSSKFSKYAKNYVYDFIDRAAALLYSLPATTASMVEIPRKIAYHNARKFLNDKDVKGRAFLGSDIKLAYGYNERMVKVGDCFIVTRFESEHNTLMATVIGDEKAYMLYLDADKLMQCEDPLVMNEEVIDPVGRVLNYILHSGMGDSFKMLLSRIDGDESISAFRIGIAS